MKPNSSSTKELNQIGNVVNQLTKAAEDLRKKQAAFQKAKEALTESETLHESLLLQFEQVCGVVKEETFVKRIAK